MYSINNCKNVITIIQAIRTIARIGLKNTTKSITAITDNIKLICYLIITSTYQPLPTTSNTNCG